MALLVDDRRDGDNGTIAADLVAAMAKVQTDLGASTAEDAVFDVARSRHNIARRAELAARDLSLPPIDTSDRSLPSPLGDISVRTYNPASQGPLIIFVHGGGWIGGSLDTHDPMARWFAHQTGAMLVSVEYDLAPENPFPRANNQVAAAIAAISHDAAPGQPIFVMGDSAGANIAAMALLQLSAAQRQRLSGFVSVYGAYSPDMDLSSHRLYGDGRYGVSEARMRWCWTLYAPQLFPADREQLTPLGRIPPDFPRTLCVGTECDLLLDDTLAFYSSLAASQIDVSLSLWPRLTHACLHYVGTVASVTDAASSIVRFIRQHSELRRVGSDASPGVTSRAKKLAPDLEPLFAATRSRMFGSVAHQIARDIFSGKLKPGQSLQTEEAASASMEISRSAYREAMRTLWAKGLVTSQPKVGTKIAPRSNWSILDADVLDWIFEAEPDAYLIRALFELRAANEPRGAAAAARNRDERDLAELSDALTQMRGEPPGSIGWLSAASDFHSTMLRASGNEAWQALTPAIVATLRWSVRLEMTRPGPVHRNLEPNYWRILSAVAEQDFVGAETAVSDLAAAEFDRIGTALRTSQ